MSRPMLAVEASDEVFTAWMRSNLDQAAERFGLRLAGSPVLGWRLRSIGARAECRDGPRWLRVVSEYPEYAGGDSLTGNVDASALPLPEIPRVGEVSQRQADGRVQRAESCAGAWASRYGEIPASGGDWCEIASACGLNAPRIGWGGG